MNPPASDTIAPPPRHRRRRFVLSGRTVRVDYLDYDWSLNEQAPGSDEAPAPPAESENSNGPS